MLVIFNLEFMFGFFWVIFRGWFGVVLVVFFSFDCRIIGVSEILFFLVGFEVILGMIFVFLGWVCRLGVYYNFNFKFDFRVVWRYN